MDICSSSDRSNRRFLIHGESKTDLARSWQQKLQKEVKVDDTSFAYTLLAFLLTIGICVCVKPPFVMKDAQYKSTFNYPLIVGLACALAVVVYVIDDSVLDTLGH